MLLRAYRPEDCPALAQLFYDTVHAVNARDYAPAQLDAWATGTVDLCAWNASFLAHRTLVAQLEGQIAGFGDIDVSSGYLDRLYVHKDFQSRGIATALEGALEGALSVPLVYTDASITAKPFFLGRGYRLVREQRVERHGVALTNFRMEKLLLR